MDELDLKHVLIIQPDFIEPGLIFKDKEVNLDGKRCDLLYTDKDGTELYVEVKLKVKDNAYGQLARYDDLVDNPMARFMLVGLSFQDGLKGALRRNGYEYCELSEEKIVGLIERMKIIVNAEVKKKQAEVRSEMETKLKGNSERESRFTILEERVDFLLKEVTSRRGKQVKKEVILQN